MEEGGREDSVRVLPGSAPSDPQSTRSGWQWAGLILTPQPRRAKAAAADFGGDQTGPFHRLLRNFRNRATGYWWPPRLYEDKSKDTSFRFWILVLSFWLLVPDIFMYQTACHTGQRHFVACPVVACGAAKTSYSFHVGYRPACLGTTSASHQAWDPWSQFGV